MDTLGKLKTAWNKEFNCEISEELIERVECAETRTPAGPVNQWLTDVLSKTDTVIEQLKLKLRQEEFLHDFLTSEIDTLKTESETKGMSSCEKDSPDPSTLYAQVNKPVKNDNNKERHSGDNNTQNGTKQTGLQIRNSRRDKSNVYEEISFPINKVEDEKKQMMLGSVGKKGPQRGSVKAKIKMFQRSDSSSDESGAAEGDYETLVVKPAAPEPLPRPVSRPRRRVDAYEEIALPMDTDSKSASKPEISSSSNGGMTHGGSTQNSSGAAVRVDTNAYTGFKQEGSVLVHTQQAVTRDKPTEVGPPPVPKRKSKGKEVIDSGDNALKKTEELTLKQSDQEPKVSTGAKKHSDSHTDIRVVERSKVPAVDRTIDDDEGDYCSISEIQPSANSKQHVTLVRVTSGEPDKNDSENTGNDDGSKNVTVLSVQKSDRELSKSTENLSTFFIKSSTISRSTELLDRAGLEDNSTKKSNFRKSENDAVTERESEMKRLFGRKSSGSISSSKKSDGGSPVIGTRYKSRSSSESDQEDLMTTVKVDIFSESNNRPENDSPQPLPNKRANRKHVPDYEKWNFQTLISKTGISIADHDNYTDTSEDDTYDNVADSGEKETISGYSDDSGVCETSTPDDTHAGDQVDSGTGEGRDVPQHPVSPTDLMQPDRGSTASCVTLDGDVFMAGETPSPNLINDRRQILRTESMEEDTTSICSMDDQLDKRDLEETMTAAHVRVEQLRMRHLVVKGILESEKSYLHVLEQLSKAKHYLQSTAMKQNADTITLEDVTTIFYKIDDIYQVHKEFVLDLESKVKHWSDEQIIGPTFKTLVVYFKVYEEYVQNYPTAVETIRKNQENEDTKALLEKLFKPKGRLNSIVSMNEQLDTFKDETAKLEDVLLKPVQRIQTNNLVLHDLIKHTPEDHPDHKDLMKAVKLSEENLKNTQPGKLGSDQNCETRRHLVKSGFIVEILRDKKKTRQLRYVFLFNDTLVCTKYKGTKHKEVAFKYLWYLPVANLRTTVSGEQKYTVKESLDDLKIKIGNLKVELREEMLKADCVKEKPFALRRAERAIEKLKKKIQEQEATLVEGLPRLPMGLEVDDCRGHTFLFSTDYEREEWREAINSQHNKCDGIPMVPLSNHDCEILIATTKQNTQVNGIGTVLLKKDEEMLNGSLNVTIHKMQGLDSPCDVYCCLEMDSYGHFYKKAQTRVSKHTTDASWDQDFELDLDGSQTLRILCYRKRSEKEDVIVAKCALELSHAWLNTKFNEKTISMNDVSLTISIRHTPASKTLKRTQSRYREGIFGVKIETVTKRECKTVPSIVTTCVQQVERRGLDEVGIYRVSGVTSDIMHLKKFFDKNPISANAFAEDMDIHAISGVLKLYFRELPEPLFTDQYYKSFIQAIELQNEDAKEKCMLTLLHSLPEANYYTIVYMIEHLARVANQAIVNKMSMSNLATVFGPTLLNPAVTETQVDPMLQVVMAARDANIQSEVVHYYIKLATSGKNIRKSAKPDT